MLRVVAPLLSQMLHLKALTINIVAGVAGFLTISSFKPRISARFPMAGVKLECALRHAAL